MHVLETHTKYFVFPSCNLSIFPLVHSYYLFIGLLLCANCVSKGLSSFTSFTTLAVSAINVPILQMRTQKLLRGQVTCSMPHSYLRRIRIEIKSSFTFMIQFNKTSVFQTMRYHPLVDCETNLRSQDLHF